MAGQEIVGADGLARRAARELNAQPAGPRFPFDDRPDLAIPFGCKNLLRHGCKKGI